MRKRIVPALLALVLILALVPTAFAAPMTLVLQTIGDTNKEFIYYIEKGDVTIYPMPENIVEIQTAYQKCHCGFTVFAFQEDVDTIWRNHTRICKSFSSIGSITLYKIPLKNGESINI